MSAGEFCAAVGLLLLAAYGVSLIVAAFARVPVF